MTENLYSYAQQPEINKTVTDVVLIFNKTNGEFLSVVNMPIELVDGNDPFCIYIAEKMDFNNQTVEGKLTIKDDGSWEKDYLIINNDEVKPRIYEEQLDTLVAYKITTKYPVVKQVNILAAVVKQLAEKAGLETEELDEYLDFVQLVKDTNKLHKDYYKNTEEVTYVSKEEALASDIRKFEGGLHEAVGEREITGGLVF